MINTIQINIYSCNSSGAGYFHILKQISGFRYHFTWISYQLFPYSIYKDWTVIIDSNTIWIYDNKQNNRTSDFCGSDIILGDVQSGTNNDKTLFKWEKQVHEYLNNQENGN